VYVDQRAEGVTGLEQKLHARRPAVATLEVLVAGGIARRVDPVVAMLALSGEAKGHDVVDMNIDDIL